MRNRAKCKKCNSIVESYHSTDYVMCKCGEIAVCEGAALKCAARDYNNFVRVDDDGNEIVVTVIEPHSNTKIHNDAVDISTTHIKNTHPTPTYIDKLDMLDAMIKSVEKLPQAALSTPITHYDYLSVLMLLSSILRDDSR